MTSIEPKGPKSIAADEYFGLPAAELAERNSLATAQEISQQPRMWREAFAAIDAARVEIDAWLQPKLQLPAIQVVFCGAGTSAFIGDSVAAWLRAKYLVDNVVAFDSVSTTDLVADPAQFLSVDRPTIMVSFARSGDSPESVASVELADENLSVCFHLILTCNPNGKLADYAKSTAGMLCIVMPDGANDRGFAMTSSYSSMLVSCAAIFAPDAAHLEHAATSAEVIIRQTFADISVLAKKPFDRLVVLGSGCLTGTAREVALKCLELSAGKVVAISDTPLGFRHGPKMIVSPSTMVVALRSGNVHTSKYDQDMVHELTGDAQVIGIEELNPEQLLSGVDVAIDDIWLSLVYVVYCQILAFLKSYDLGVSVDSPSPSGEVNRVVQGVTIYPYQIVDS